MTMFLFLSLFPLGWNYSVTVLQKRLFSIGKCVSIAEGSNEYSFHHNHKLLSAVTHK